MENERQKEEAAVYCDPISSTVVEIEKLIEIRNTSKDVHQDQNVVVQPEKNQKDDNWSQMSSPDSIVQSMSKFSKRFTALGEVLNHLHLLLEKLTWYRILNH